MGSGYFCGKRGSVVSQSRSAASGDARGLEADSAAGRRGDHECGARYRISSPRSRENGGTSILAYLHPLHRRSEEHTSELQSRGHLVCRLLLEKKKWTQPTAQFTFINIFLSFLHLQ